MPGAVGGAMEEDVLKTAVEEDKTVTLYTEPQQQPLPAPIKRTEEIPVRRNFQETAFFYPDLMTDNEGNVILKFKVPESLTEWKFMGLAYTKDLKEGYIERSLVTRKDLMVIPNPPRFFREGDKMAFSVKVVSMADHDLTGKVYVQFFDAVTMKPVDDLLENTADEKDFMIAQGKSQSV